MALSDKKRRFVQEYLKDLNATRAAIRAGYSARSAKQIGSVLKKTEEVSAAIEEILAAQSISTSSSLERIIREHERIAFSSILDVVDISDDGSYKLKPRVEISPDALAAIAGVTMTRQGGMTTLNVKMTDKQPSLKALLEYELLKSGLSEDAAAEIANDEDPEVKK
jgi:phage terminase small subunit